MNCSKQIKFHELMIDKANIEVEFWQREINFHQDKLSKFADKDKEYTV